MPYLPPTLNLIADSSKKTFARGPAPMQVTRERIEAIPYSTLGVRVGPASWALMVLTTINDQELEWISADGVKFVTVEGTIVRTRGMPRDLSSTLWSGGQAPPQFADPSALAQGKQQSRSLSFQPDLEGWVPVVSQISARGTENVDLFGESKTLAVYRERLDFPTWRWSAENRYWVDEKNNVRKSVQRYCPEVPPITLEFFPRFA
jgi:group 4 capsule polysaccharide lipoprotein GfcB/YjbF